MLSIDDIVRINIFIGSAGTSSAVFDVGLILGSSETIAAATRVVAYDSLDAMATGGFVATSPEYLAAAKYFSVSPAPQSLLVGRINEGETPLQALKACIAVNPEFDGIYLVEATAAQLREIAEYLIAIDKYHLYYSVGGTVAAAIAADGTFTVMKNLDTRRAFGLYSSDTHPGAAAMGKLSGLFHRPGTGAVKACYSTIASLVTNALTSEEVASIKAVNGNVYVARRNRGLLEQGATASGMRIDDSIYLDMIRGDIQDALFERIATANTRLPQTDSTSALLMNAASDVLNGYLALGVLAAGTWTGESIGNVETGDTLETGFVLYVEPYVNQSAADRAAHKAMPITIGMILGGSVESVVLNVYAQQ